MNKNKVTDAEATVKFAINDAIVFHWDKRWRPDFAAILKEEIFKKIFADHLVWAVKKYIQENSL